ncbi:hypothetical protein AAC387_Pa06g0995 [Persea americana]
MQSSSLSIAVFVFLMEPCSLCKGLAQDRAVQSYTLHRGKRAGSLLRWDDYDSSGWSCNLFFFLCFLVSA